MPPMASPQDYGVSSPIVWNRAVWRPPRRFAAVALLHRAFILVVSCQISPPPGLEGEGDRGVTITYFDPATATCIGLAHLGIRLLIQVTGLVLRPVLFPLVMIF